MRPRILVVSCGGTISSRAVAPGEGAAPAVSAAQLVAAVPQLAEVADVTAHSFSLVPSSFETLDTATALLATVEGLLAGPDRYVGVVVTHGTDTLEEVAFALDLLWRHDLPLVLTGAMRNVTLPGADGPANLLAAVVTAADPQAAGLGVLVVLNDVVHAARAVRKQHSTDVAAFVSTPAGPLGFVAEQRLTLILAPLRRPVLERPPTGTVPAVALLSMTLGDDGRLLPVLAGLRYAGLVLEGMGGGHLPPAVADSAALRELHEAVPVVIASRTGAGPVLGRTYDYAGSEVGLRERGFVFAGILDGRKARVLLALLLALGYERSRIARDIATIGLDPAAPTPVGPR